VRASLPRTQAVVNTADPTAVEALDTDLVKAAAVAVDDPDRTVR
jgi:hypothetical protein